MREDILLLDTKDCVHLHTWCITKDDFRDLGKLRYCGLLIECSNLGLF
jgi:hypothetical protein